MEKITPEQFFADLIEFNKVSENRNKQDQRLGQYLCNKYQISTIEDIGNLFYKESYSDCLMIFEALYVSYGRSDGQGRTD